jgi:hypothetical protein
VHEQPKLDFNIRVADTDVPLSMTLHFGELTEAVTDWFETGRYYTVDAPVWVEGVIAKDVTEYLVQEIHFDVFHEGTDGNELLLHEVIT